jgi:hypothetical protein
MVIEYENRRYQMLLGNDIVNTGMWLEMKDVTDGEDDLVLFAFWSQVDRAFTFHAYREELPFEIVETFVKTARQRLLAKKDEG